MKQNFQAAANIYGESACYFDSLIQAANDSTDRLRFYFRAIDRAWIQEDCFVLEPAEILRDLTLRKWICNKQGADYKAQPGEIEILRFDWTSKPGTTLSHFVLGDGKGNIKYDPMGDNSPVAKYGKIASKRIFTEIKG